MTALVVAVHRSARHAFSKETVEGVRLLEGLGVEGDAHSGTTVQHRSRVRFNPALPNLRQVHLLHAELLDDLGTAGHPVRPGELGENVTTRGIDLLGLPVGTRLHLGEKAVVVVTGLRNPCKQIEAFRPGLLEHVVRPRDTGPPALLAGVMATAARSGDVSAGDQVGVELPPEPHRYLAKV
ncbi:MAG: MOSC domain-containing protein [Nocardioides sp.]|nr:MOSC domain-containing protein [Nocardioides sp.]